MRKILSTSDFCNKLSNIFPNITVLSEYLGNNTYILVKDIYGEYLVFPSGLLRKMYPSIKSCLNKTQYFINKAKEVHNNKYDYSKSIYKKATLKVKIICPIHGEFYQMPCYHLKGCDCPKCGFIKASETRTITNNEFISRCKEIHKNKYDYSFTNYKHSRIKIMITCPEHGNFLQTPDAHLQGQGCMKCIRNDFSRTGFIKKSKNRDCTCYIIKCFNDEEIFYKIGITSLNTKKRFNGNRNLPYNYEVLYEIIGTAETIYNLENYLHKLYKNFKYKPKISFIGQSECFSEVDLNLIEKRINLKQKENETN
jgi:hypothetical protein